MAGAIIMIIVLILGGLALLKNEVTFNAHMRIANAIYLYSIDCMRSGKVVLVDYRDMETYDQTFLRLWDWGYTRILSPAKFQIIKPYIKKGR